MRIKVGRRGTITIPKELRSGLDTSTVLEVLRREDGVIELRPQQLIDASQAWFWRERWQRMERDANQDFEAGRFETFDTVEEFLENLSDQPQPSENSAE